MNSVQGPPKNFVTSMHCKSQVNKPVKSIDSICAKLQLNADGLEEKHSVDDVIDKSSLLDLDGISEATSISETVATNTCVEGKKSSQHSPEIEKVDMQKSRNSVLTSYTNGDHVESMELSNGARIKVERDLYEETVVVRTLEDTKEQDAVATKMADEHMEGEKSKVKARHATQYNNWHYTDMLKAINAVQSKNLSMTAASRKYRIPRTTLRHYLNDSTGKEPKLTSFSLPKSCEIELVKFIIAQPDTASEKLLYKFIFEKAKQMSQQLAYASGDEKRRHLPTPAWIRRFVYRHKQLYNLFPTFLTKFEHPLHGGTKILSEMGDSGLSIENELAVHHVNAISESYAPRKQEDRGNISRTLHENGNTEIIFPVSTGEKTQASSEFSRGHTSDEFSYDSEKSHDEFDSRVHRHVEHKSHDSYAAYSIISGDAKSNGDKRRPCSREVSVFYRSYPHTPPNTTPSDVRTAVNSSKVTHLMNHLTNHPPAQYSMRPSGDTSSRHSSPKSPEMSNGSFISLSSIPLVSSTGHSFTSHAPSSERYYHDTVRTSDSTLSGLASKNCTGFQHFPPSFPKSVSDDDMPSISASEFEIAATLLETMERSLGPDYVQLFTERYHRNKKLERLYSKWVKLQTELENFKEKQ